MADGDIVRIASGQGFWGDDPEAPVRQVEGGDIDYLMMDYLAEVTMSIMQKQRARDASACYARDCVPLMGRSFPICDLLPWMMQYFVEFHQLQGE